MTIFMVMWQRENSHGHQVSKLCLLSYFKFSYAWKQTNTHMQKTIFNIQTRGKQQKMIWIYHHYEKLQWVRNNERNHMNKEILLNLKSKINGVFLVVFSSKNLMCGCGRMKNSLPVCPISNPWNCESVTLYFTRDFADIIKVMDLKTRRLSWIIWLITI